MFAQLRASGALTTTAEARKHCSEGQRRRFQRPEEIKKLEAARELSFKAIDFGERAKLMHAAFLQEYGSFLELAKMGLRAPRRKPNKLELEVAKILGSQWDYVGDGKFEIGGLIPDFVHKNRKEVLEVLGCYYHSCPIHHPNVQLSRTATPAFRESVYKEHGFEPTFLWEHEIGEKRKLAFRDAGVDGPSVCAK